MLIVQSLCNIQWCVTVTKSNESKQFMYYRNALHESTR